MADFTTVPIGLVGIGGYGVSYVNSLEVVEREKLMRLASAVVRTRGKYPETEAKLAALAIPFRGSFDEMLAEDRDKIEMAAIPTGIDSHRKLMIQAVEAGLDVVLEKPSTATIQDLDAMEEALARTGRSCAIGFQSQSHPTVTGLKREIAAGRLGRVREIVITGLWRRDDDYYKRNSWAGKLMAGGNCILDGTINNPLAHYLFNALYFAQPEPGKAALPVSVRAELYRAHQIESEDTSCLEVLCDNGVKVWFYASLCSPSSRGTQIQIFGEKLRAVWEMSGPVKYFDGDRPAGELPASDFNANAELFRNAARVHRGVERDLNCPLAMTRAHVLAVDGAFESAGKTVAVPASAVKIWEDPEAPGHVQTSIVGIEDLIPRAARERKLFSDLGVPWAVQTKPFSLKGYKHFSL